LAGAVLHAVLDGNGSMNAPAGAVGSGLRWTVRVVLSVAAVVAAWTGALVTQRYLSDSGLIPSGTGASLINPRRAQAALVIAVAALVVVALAAVFLRQRMSSVAKLVAAAVAVVLSGVALIAYPHATNARFVMLDPATGREAWSIDATAEWIAGVTSQTGNQVVLRGTDDADHNCEGWQGVSVTIDLARREVVTVRVVPRYPSPTDPKPASTVEPDPRRFRIEQGTPVRRCSS
jgi:hypothetical protein